MKLTLTISNKNLLMDNQEHEYTFTELGGSIGRNPLNDWVICDRRRFISSKHAQISFRDNNFYITDISTNGTYINDGNDPIGTGNSVPLTENMRLNLGDLKINVHIESEKPASNAQQNLPVDDLFADILGDVAPPPPAQPIDQQHALLASEVSIDELIGVSSNGDSAFSDHEVTDPLAILDGKTDSLPNNMVNEPLQADAFSKELLEGGSDLNTPFNPVYQEATPSQGETGIPDDWDPLADLFGEQQQPPQPLPNQNIQTNTSQLNDALSSNQTVVNDDVDIMALINGSDSITGKPQTQPDSRTPANQAMPQAGSMDQIDAVLTAAGLNPTAYSVEHKQQLPKLIGTMLRSSLDGLVTALMARNQVKTGLRMAVTTIAPVENNPLKFSINGEEALRNLLSAREGYLGPNEAIREGFQDLQIHQLAMMSATQKTLQALTQKLNPELLSQQFEQSKNGGLKLGTKKMHYWDQFQAVYRDIEESISDDFQVLLGDVFANAYEEQTIKAKQGL